MITICTTLFGVVITLGITVVPAIVEYVNGIASKRKTRLLSHSHRRTPSRAN